MIGDVVAARVSQSSPSVFQLQPPHFGKVTDEPVAPLAVNETILWDNALKSIVSAASAANLFLDVIEDPPFTTVNQFKGRTVLRIAPGGPVAGDPAGGTSREYVGVVVAIYRRRPFEGAPGSGGVYLLVASGDLFFEDLASRFTVLTGR